MAISLDEALGMSLADEADESIHVDVNTRQITIPESQKLFGVESDADVEVKHIVIDGRYADGNRDLSKLAWRVVYRNAKKGSGYYLIPSVVANKNSIEMDWLIKRSVVAYKGTVDFILCAFATTSSGEVTPEWNSTLGQGIVLKGLETSAIDIGKESVDELSKILYETVTAKDVTVSAASNATANAENAAASAKKAQDVADSLPADYTTAVNEIAALKTNKADRTELDTMKQQVENITPDNSTIGEKPWSSKHIIDMLCPPLEESGNPVVCYPVAGYALGVKASWEPVQEGSGDPSPDNVRPIKGRDSVKVERCGENVIEFLSINDLNSGIKIAVDAEKNITLNGTIAAKSNIIIGGCRLHWVAGKTYTMHIKKVGGSVSLGSGDGITFAYSLFTTDYEHYFRGDTNSTNIGAYIASNVALVETELVFMLQCWRVGTVFNNFKFQIEVVEGTTTPTTYTPYIGQTNTLTLPETVYGGEVDVVTGEGIKNWKRVVFDGTENWNSRPENYISYSLALPRRAQTGFCTHFKKILYDAIRPDTGTGETGCYLEFSSSAIFNVTFENVTDWKNYLAAQYAAGTPVCIVFQYANEVNEPFTATGAQPIPALVGANTVLTDADSATVTGRADPIKRITDLEAAVASIN